MDTIEIQGGKTLKGAVQASGSKNSSLPLLFSTLLASGEHTFHNIPKVKDIKTACQLLENLDCQIKWTGSDSLSVQVPKKLKSFKAPYELMRTMRAGILCLGPLIARWKKAEVSLPGGCAIGNRPVNWHIQHLKQLGAEIKLKKGYIHGHISSLLKGAEITFEKPTVGGTQNLMMAGSLCDGHTRIHQAAKEPEIEDLALYLNKMGAQVKGAGTSTIDIEGVKTLTPSSHHAIPDRIETATLLIASAVTGGQITVQKCQPLHLEAVLSKLKECGLDIQSGKDWLTLASPKKPLLPADIQTAPYPGFPTDVQAQFMALMTQAKGESLIEECIFENRFMHIPELLRLNANIKIQKQKARVYGPSPLKGAVVTATDLRASSCLILAGLCAENTTTIRRVYHLDRGYENLEQKLSILGASIKRFHHST